MADDAQGAGTQVDLDAVVAGIIAKNSGDATKSVEMLLTENHALRQKNAGLRTEVEELSTNALKEGQRVLDTEQASTFDQYVALGSVESIVQDRERLSTQSAALTQIERQQIVQSVAAEHKFDANALERLLKADEAVLVQNGDSAAIKVKDGEAQDFSKYVDEQWEIFKPSLQGKTGTTYVPQGSSKDGAATVNKSLVQDFLDKNKERAERSPFSTN